MDEDKVIKDIEKIIDKWKRKEINGDECLYQISKEIDEANDKFFESNGSNLFRYEKTIKTEVINKGEYPFSKLDFED